MFFEGIIFLLILYVFLTGLLNTGWENNPLVWTVVPLWALVAYIVLILQNRFGR